MHLIRRRPNRLVVRSAPRGVGPSLVSAIALAFTLSLASALMLALAFTDAAFAAPEDGATAEVADGKVDARLDQRADDAVEKRLRSTFSAIRALESVEIEVKAGVVRLAGLVDTADASELAGELAARVEGVTAVDNLIEERRSIAHRLDLALDRLRDRAWQLVDRLPLLVLGVLIVALAVFLSRLAVAWERPFELFSGNVFVRDLSRQAVRLAIIVGGVLVALEILDATALVGAVLGAAGVVGLAVGFAFRDLVENYVASILLSLRRPFSPHDLVEIEGHLGTVARLTSRATILLTPAGNHVRIPNGQVFKATIENYTRNPMRRFSFGVGVGVDEDLVVASDLGRDVLKEMNGVADDPEPFARIDVLGDSSVTMQFFGWVDQREADFGKVKSEAIRLVKQCFDRHEIEMPEPIHRLRIESTAPANARASSSTTSDAPASPSTTREGDVSPDSHLDQLVGLERASGEPDLLDGSALEE